jgi:hypothetical protein
MAATLDGVDGNGFQVYKGDNDEKVMDERKSDGDTVPHMENFLGSVKSRNHQDLHAEIEIGASRRRAVPHGQHQLPRRPQASIGTTAPASSPEIPKRQSL